MLEVLDLRQKWNLAKLSKLSSFIERYLRETSITIKYEMFYNDKVQEIRYYIGQGTQCTSQYCLNSFIPEVEIDKGTRAKCKNGQLSTCMTIERSPKYLIIVLKLWHMRTHRQRQRRSLWGYLQKRNEIQLHIYIWTNHITGNLSRASFLTFHFECFYNSLVHGCTMKNIYIDLNALILLPEAQLLRGSVWQTNTADLYYKLQVCCDE